MKCINTGLGYGKREWGAEKNEQYIILILGKTVGERELGV